MYCFSLAGWTEAGYPHRSSSPDSNRQPPSSGDTFCWGAATPARPGSSFHKPGRIDILLGADAYPELMVPDHMITGPVKTPAAQRTIFGWAIVGPVSYKADSSVAIPTHFALGQTAEDNLDALLSQFWESEEPEQEPAALSVVEEQVQAHYSDTVTYDSSSCKYQVTLPRRNDVPPLGDSRAQAHSRYITNENPLASGSHSRTWSRNTWTWDTLSSFPPQIQLQNKCSTCQCTLLLSRPVPAQS